ncbi:MAG: hypothetical protein ACRENG_23620, partial [bacterium]
MPPAKIFLKIKVTFLLVWGAVLLLCSSFAQQAITIQIVDALRKTPIEGARIYVKDHAYALRSDVNGRVTVPAQFSKVTLSIRAKNYKPKEVKLPLKNASSILLEFDEALVNPVEQKLSFTRADTLRGAYGPYRVNNDLLFYDLNIRLNIAEKYLSGYN